jgi:glycosyltransferase involved in cell wall biosynthesis
MYGLDPERFSFLYVFDANSSIERKNPEAAIRAFSIAFSTDEPVTLLVKISNPDGLEHRQRLQKMVETAAKTGLDIRFVLEDIPRRDILGLISATDCYVSLHRAEGFSYTCAEAMAYGKPVIATNYSGNLQFMDHENSYLVDFEEVEVAVPEGPFQRGSVWAEANVEQAAMFMRDIYSDIEAARIIGDRARRDVRRQLSYEAISEIAHKALSQGAR